MITAPSWGVVNEWRRFGSGDLLLSADDEDLAVADVREARQQGFVGFAQSDAVEADSSERVHPIYVPQ